MPASHPYASASQTMINSIATPGTNGPPRRVRFISFNGRNIIRRNKRDDCTLLRVLLYVQI